MDIKLYDTVKDKNGKRYRVTETKNDGSGHIIATLKGINPDGSARRGMPRKVGLEVLERDYTRINLAPVEVKKIDDLRKEETEMAQVPTPIQKAMEKQKEAVRGLSEKEVEEAVKRATFGVVSLPENDKRVKDLEKDIEVLRAECIALKEEKKQLERHVELADEEIAALKDENKKHLRTIDELKKTNSKMKYAHEEEVRALEDELMEEKALAKHNAGYKETVEDNSVTFSEILHLAETMQLMSTGTAKIAKAIIDKTEEWI